MMQKTLKEKFRAERNDTRKKMNLHRRMETTGNGNHMGRYTGFSYLNLFINIYIHIYIYKYVFIYKNTYTFRSFKYAGKIYDSKSRRVGKGKGSTSS